MGERTFRLERREIARVANVARPIFGEYLSQYDFKKYPAQALGDLRAKFSSGRIDTNAISLALRWKWGHWSKSNIPEAHESLIREAQGLCDKFNARPRIPDPHQTFDFWAAELGSQRRYISRAFLTHLQHPKVIAIIDQHNWRSTLKLLEGGPHARQLLAIPRTYTELVALSSFCRSLSKALRADSDDVDHFLMQFGKCIKNPSRIRACRRSHSAPRPSLRLR